MGSGPTAGTMEVTNKRVQLSWVRALSIRHVVRRTQMGTSTLYAVANVQESTFV